MAELKWPCKGCYYELYHKDYGCGDCAKMAVYVYRKWGKELWQS